MSDDATAYPLDTTPTIGEHAPGGLLAVGTEVQVGYAHGTAIITGTIASAGATPAAYLTIDQRDGLGRRLLFCSAIDYVDPNPFPHPAMT